MKKAALVDEVAAQVGDLAAAELAVDAVLRAIVGAVAAGERVDLGAFGVFERLERPARVVPDPKTGQPVEHAESAVPRFRAGAGFRTAVRAGSERRVAAPAPTKPVAPSVRRPSDPVPVVQPPVTAAARLAGAAAVRTATTGVVGAAPVRAVLAARRAAAVAGDALAPGTPRRRRTDPPADEPAPVQPAAPSQRAEPGTGASSAAGTGAERPPVPGD